MLNNGYKGMENIMEKIVIVCMGLLMFYMVLSVLV